LSEQVRKPGPVKEETAPIGSDALGTTTKTASVHSDRSDSAIKSQSGPNKRKPVPVTEPTKAVPPESTSAPDSGYDHLNENRWSRLFMVFVSFVVFWLLYATIASLVDAWSTSVWLAAPLTIITIVFITILGGLAWREWRSIQVIDRIQETQKELRQYINEDSIIGVHETLKPVLACIKVYYPEEHRQFDDARHERKTVKEYLSLLDNIILSKLDKDVDDAINKASLSVAGLVAISPHPALDAVIVMFRANMLLRKISNIYGLELTGLSSLYLFKHTIVSAITAAGIEEIGSMLMVEFGAGFTEKTGKVVAEAMVSASRMYRLGKIAKKMIRPLSLEI